MGVPATAEQVDIDAGDARGHHQQGPDQACQRHRAMVAPAHDGDGNGQDADDEGGGAHAGQLHAEGQQHVIQQVAGEGLAQQGNAIGTRELARNAPHQRQRGNEGDQPVGKIAADRQFPGGENGQ